MLSAFYNYFIVIFTLFIITRNLSFKYFQLNNKQFIITLSYHLFLTLLFLFFLQNQAADYKTYLELKHVKEFSFTHAFATTEIIYNFIKVLKSILFFNDFNIILSFSLISYFAILIFTKNLIKLGVDKKIALMLFFIPGIHIWTSLPGKDCLILFFLSCFFYMYIDRKIFLALFFVFFVLLIRPQIGTIFLLSIGITEFFLIRGYKKLIILISSLLGFYLILSSSFSSGYLLDKAILSENLIIQMLSKLSELSSRFINSDSSYEISNLYFNIFNYVVFPLEFIFKSNSLYINISILIEMITLLYVVSLILNNKKNAKIDKKLIYFLFIVSFVYLIILPQALFNFGLNIRQKWMIIPFLIYLSFLLKNLFVKIKKT